MVICQILQVAQPGTPTGTSLALQGFMLAAQQETWDPPLDGGTIGHDDEVDLKVFLMNDQQYNIRGRPTLQTEDILEVRHPLCIFQLIHYHLCFHVFEFNLTSDHHYSNVSCPSFLLESMRMAL